jgi:hypothetical protein
MARTKQTASKATGNKPPRPRWSAFQRLALSNAERQTIARTEKDMRTRFKNKISKPKKVAKGLHEEGDFHLIPREPLKQRVEATFQGLHRHALDSIMAFLHLCDPGTIGPSGLASIVRLNRSFRIYVRMTMTPLSADPFSSSRERQPYSAPTLRALHGSALSRHVGGLPHFVVASVSQEDMQGLASLLQLQPPIYRFAGLRRLTLLLNVPGVAELSFGLPPNIQELNLKCTDVSGQVHGLLTAANNLSAQLLPPLQRFLLRQPGELSRAQAALRGCEGLGQRSRRGEVRERSDRVTSRNRRGRPEGARQRRAECSTKDWR